MDNVEKLAEMLARIESLEAAQAMPVLPYSSLDDASVPEKSADGSVRSVWGRQWDGTHGIVDLTGPKPPTPSVPVVVGAPGGLNVTWDGAFADGAVAPMDFARVEVHVYADPDLPDVPGGLGRATVVGSIETPMGATLALRLTPGTYYASFITRTRAGVGSDAARFDDGATAEPIPDTADLEAIQTALNGKNTNTHSPDEPGTTEGMAPGDLWFQHAGVNVVGQWQWDGTEWVAQHLTSAVIANLEVGKLLTGNISAGQRIIAGDEDGARVELDSFGLRKYATNGTDIEVDLSSAGATFSGTITGSAVVGGDIYTALAGPRIHIHDGIDPDTLTRVLATLGFGTPGPDVIVGGTDISLHSGLLGVDPGSLAVLQSSRDLDGATYEVGVVVLSSPTSPTLNPAQLLLYEITADNGDIHYRAAAARLEADLIMADATNEVEVVAGSVIQLKAPELRAPWLQTNPHGATLTVVIVANVAARAAALAAITGAYAPAAPPHPVVVWRQDATPGRHLEVWNGTTWDPIGDQPAATTTVPGVVELATSAETITGTDTTRALTPAGLAARTATETRTGLVELATTTEATTGTDTTRAVTPAGLKATIDAAGHLVPAAAGALSSDSTPVGATETLLLNIPLTGVTSTNRYRLTISVSLYVTSITTVGRVLARVREGALGGALIASARWIPTAAALAGSATVTLVMPDVALPAGTTNLALTLHRDIGSGNAVALAGSAVLLDRTT